MFEKSFACIESNEWGGRGTSSSIYAYRGPDWRYTRPS